MTAPLPPIAELVPHAGQMVLLQEVEDWDADGIACLTSTHRNADNPLRRDAILPAVCGAEYGAQAVAVHGALSGRNAAGYLAAVKDLRTHVTRLDDVPGALRVTATRRLADSRSLIYAFAVSAAATGRALVDGQVTIFLTAEDTP